MLDKARTIVQTASRPVTFSGAGLSAESGIPTFREAQTGLWSKYDPMTLASPGGFAADPELVVDWYNDRRRRAAATRPNPAHRAMAARKDITHITQNVDDLLERAGADDVVHLHGSFGRDRCNARCGYREAVDLANPRDLHRCPNCGAWMRPDVVWFGEPLPGPAWTRAESLVTSADVLIVIGTSAAVYPAAGLITTARNSGAKLVVVNTDPGNSTGLQLTGPAGAILPELLEQQPHTSGD